MSANNPYAGLARSITSAAVANNSKYGSTGRSLIDTLRPFLDFVGGAYSAYQANPEGGMTAIPGAVAAVQGLATRKYLNDYQDQVQQEYQAQKAKWSQLGRVATDFSQGNPAFRSIDPETGQENYHFYGDWDDLNGVLGLFGNSQFAQGVNRAITGDVPQFGPASPAAQVENFSKTYLPQMSAAVDFANRDAISGDIRGSQGLSLTYPGSSLDNMKTGKSQTPKSFGNTIMQTGGPIQAGTKLTEREPIIDFNKVNPFTLPKDYPGNVVDVLKAGLDDAQTANAQSITQQDNLAKQKAAQRELDAKIKGGYFINYPPSPSGGGNSNPFTVPNSAQNYYAGQAEQIKAIMQAEGLWDKDTDAPIKEPSVKTEDPGWLGTGFAGTSKQDAAASVAKRNRYNELKNLYLNARGAAEGAPTASQGQQRIQQTRQAAEGSIQQKKDALRNRYAGKPN